LQSPGDRTPRRSLCSVFRETGREEVYATPLEGLEARHPPRRISLHEWLKGRRQRSTHHLEERRRRTRTRVVNSGRVFGGYDQADTNTFAGKIDRKSVV